MLTRCPQCQTTFRVTAEQLAARNGRVRCGQCQHPFDAQAAAVEQPALEAQHAQHAPPPPQLEETSPAPANAGDLPASPAASSDNNNSFVDQGPEDFPDVPDELAAPLADDFPDQPAPDQLAEETEEPAEATEPAEPSAANQSDAAPESPASPAVEEASDTPPVADDLIIAPPLEHPLPGSEPETAEAAETANSAETDNIATEEPSPSLADERIEPTLGSDDGAAAPDSIPADRAAATVVIDNGSDDDITPRQAPDFSSAFTDDEQPPRPIWPWLLATLLLSLLIGVQALYHYRTEITAQLRGMKGVYRAFGINVPLPRNAEQISIETSDLQADTANNLLILSATLKNRANYSQDYPVIELTLTDARDEVLLRRILQASDYLAGDAAPVFAPHADLSLKLWLDVGGLKAAGYRLYVFYP